MQYDWDYLFLWLENAVFSKINVTTIHHRPNDIDAGKYIVPYGLQQWKKHTVLKAIYWSTITKYNTIQTRQLI